MVSQTEKEFVYKNLIYETYILSSYISVDDSDGAR
jgi:hypothetical protein